MIRNRGFMTFNVLVYLMVAVLAVAVGILGILSFEVESYFSPRKSSPTASSDFLAASTRAIMIANVFTNLKAEDRNVIEHAVGIGATGSAANASSQNFALYLDTFLSFYKAEQDDNFYVAVRKNSDDVFTYSRLDVKCGDNLEGYCALPETKVDSFTAAKVGQLPGTYYIGCGVGRKAIDSSLYTKDERKCPVTSQLCCVEDRDVNGVWNDPDLRTCGLPLNGVKPGVCDKNLIVGMPGKKCNTGRILIEDNGDCAPLNAYTPDAYVCCAPLTNLEAATDLGFISSIEIPILYKNEFSVLEVSAT